MGNSIISGGKITSLKRFSGFLHFWVIGTPKGFLVYVHY